MNNYAAHQRLVDDLLYHIGKSPYIRVWPRQVGFDKQKKIHYGRKGEPDIDGLIAPYGRRLGIECKTGSAELSEDQLRFREMYIKFGAIYIIARSVEQVKLELDGILKLT